MNSKQIERKVRELIRRKPKISQPGRLLGHVVNEIGVESDSTRKYGTMVEKALEKLEDEGVIELDRSGAVLNGFEAKKQPITKKAVASTKPSTSKSTAPLKATEPIPATTTPEEAKEVSKTEKLARHEMVTLALNTLQVAADEDGNLYVSSAVQVIVDELGVTAEEAKNLNDPLGRLGLRKSPRGRNDDGKKPHWVSLKVTEVTEAMLSTTAKPLSERPTPASSSDAEAGLLEIIEGLEARNGELAASAEAAEKLAGIVEELEAKIATREDETRLLTGQLEAKISAYEDAMRSATEQMNALLTEVRELRAQQLALAAPSPAVANVLKRYGKSS